MRKSKKKFGFHINPRVILALIGSLIYLLVLALFLFIALDEPHHLDYQPDNEVFLLMTLITVICCVIRRRLTFFLVLISHIACMIIGNVLSVPPTTVVIIHCSLCALVGLIAIWLKKGPELISAIRDDPIDIGSMIGDEYTSDYDGTES